MKPRFLRFTARTGLMQKEHSFNNLNKFESFRTPPEDFHRVLTHIPQEIPEYVHFRRV